MCASTQLQRNFPSLTTVTCTATLHPIQRISSRMRCHFTTCWRMRRRLLCFGGFVTSIILLYNWRVGEAPMRKLITLDPKQNFTTGFEGDVVKIIHQSWVDKNLPRLFAQWSKSFPKCFPDFDYKLWTDEDNRKLIADHYPWFLPRYDSYGAGVQKADVSRLFYLYHYGGLYCDLDCECIRNFQHLLANTSLAFGAMKGSLISSESDPAFVPEGQIENSFMYSRPRHPLIWDLILKLNATTQGMAIMASGPYLIMAGIHTARKLGFDRSTLVDDRPYLTIYPPSYFNPFSWISFPKHSCRLFGQFSTENQLKQCRDSFVDSYVVQYHTQVWDKGKAIAKEI